MINAVFYTNALIAELLFQCERIWYVVYKLVGDKTIKDDYYEEYDLTNASRSKCCSQCTKFLYELLATATSLIVVLLCAYLLSGFLKIDNHRFLDKSEVQTLFTLAPTLLLIFLSWYNKHIFFDVKHKKSETEILEEMTQIQGSKLGEILQEEKLKKEILQEILRKIRSFDIPSESDGSDDESTILETPADPPEDAESEQKIIEMEPANEDSNHGAEPRMQETTTEESIPLLNNSPPTSSYHSTSSS